jgi:hypothetical protein
MNEKLFEIASKITRPISVASIVVIAFGRVSFELSGESDYF